jgi:hypothetical protein
MIRYRGAFVAIAVALFLAHVAAAVPTLRTMFSSPEAPRTSFAGKKVAAFVFTSDDSLRMSGEEALARELGTRGIQGVATYRMIPREEIVSAERARPWLERGNVAGVVALRPVSIEKSGGAAEAVWSESYARYNSLWGFYDYSATVFINPMALKETTTVTVQTLVFDVPSNKLLWAATSSTTNPKELQGYIGDLVKAAIGEMRKQHLIK